jgi:hypothetical protein
MIATPTNAMPRVNSGAATFCASIAAMQAASIDSRGSRIPIRYLCFCIRIRFGHQGLDGLTSAEEAAALGGVGSRIWLTADTTQVFQVPADGSTWAQSAHADSAPTIKT